MRDEVRPSDLYRDGLHSYGQHSYGFKSHLASTDEVKKKTSYGLYLASTDEVKKTRYGLYLASTDEVGD